MIELNHPRTVPSHPWWPHVLDGKPLAPPLTGGGRPFIPMVRYSRAGDQLIVYWGPAETFADELDERHCVTILRALKCEDLLQGVKIWGLSMIVPIAGEPAPEAKPQPSVEPLNFRPFAHYDAANDSLLIRWLPGSQIVEQVETENMGHPMTMLLAADQKPWMLVGVIIRELSAPQEWSPKIRVPVQGRVPAT